jgi:hypothetical protein
VAWACAPWIPNWLIGPDSLVLTGPLGSFADEVKRLPAGEEERSFRYVQLADTTPFAQMLIADRDDLSYEEKLPEYRKLADDYFQVEEYEEFCAAKLAHVDEVLHEWVSGPDFDRLLVQTVTSTFPPHEHEHFIAHYRGLLAAWARDAAAA